jgi:hypothetical protein
MVINETFEPEWIRSPDARYWINSLSTPQLVTVQCQGFGALTLSATSSQVMLEETGILPNSSSCYVHDEKFKLLPHSIGKNIVNLNYTHITLPNIENILTFSEEAVLQTETTLPLHIQRFEEMAARAVSRNHVRGV